MVPEMTTAFAAAPRFRAKDFIATADRLMFAVVACGSEAGTVRCFLRYAWLDGGWRKVHSADANHYLLTHYPRHVFHSEQLDADLHGVAEAEIVSHYRPLAGLRKLLSAPAGDAVVADLQRLCSLLRRRHVDTVQLGITGSLLPGFQHAESDIDLVCYDRRVFQALRQAVQALTAAGELQPLAADDWLQAYRRRACELTLDEYIRHERRKYNKGIVNGRKFDLSLVTPPGAAAMARYRKLGPICIETTVTDASRGFDYPAEFGIDHPHIASVVSFTATYNGQAEQGERIQVAGQLEAAADGRQRIVVGASREAPGEYIKLLDV